MGSKITLVSSINDVSENILFAVVCKMIHASCIELSEDL